MSGTDPRELRARCVGDASRGRSAERAIGRRAAVLEQARLRDGVASSREYWTGGKWVRVTDDLGETRWVGINRPVRLMDKLADMDPQHRAAVMQQMQLVPGDPRLQQVVGIEHDISDLDVDITIEEGIDIPSLQAEEFQSLVQLASVQPGLIPGDVLIAASGLRDKDMILERMKATSTAASSKRNSKPARSLAQHGQAQIADLQSKAAANMALAKERTVNAASTIHDAHRTFMGLPDDNATQVNPVQPPDPEQMQPSMALAHQVADLTKKHADISKTRADTLLTAAKIPQVAQSTLHTAHQTHQVATTTNRLMQTPIPQPAPPGGAP